MISCGHKGAALLFVKEYVFWGAMKAQFQSLFCQNLYVYMFWGVKGLLRKILYFAS